MTYKRPTLKEISQRVQNHLEAGGIAYSFKGLLGNAISGLSHILHGHIDYVVKQIRPDTATGEFLDQWANIFKVPRKGPQPTKVKVIIKADLAHSEERVSKDWLIDKFDFHLIGSEISHILTGDKQTIELCSEKLGIIEISLSSVVKMAINTVGIEILEIAKIIPGSETESDELLRHRLLRAIAYPPRGGTAMDYINWTESVASIRKAWVRTTKMTGIAGHIEIAFSPEVDGQYHSLTEELINNVFPRLAPADVQINVIKPKAIPIKIQFEVKPNDLTAKVWQEIDDIFRKAEPKGFLDDNLRLTTGRIPLHKIAAIGEKLAAEQFILAEPKQDIEVNDLEIAGYVRPRL